jgi:adenylate cyclase
VVALFLRFGGLADGDGDLDTAATQCLDRWITGAQQVLQQHGGVLLELILGDKGSYLYAAFGAAKAHEDDPPRALRAALALRALFDDGSPGAGAHIGMASGTLRVGGYGGRSRQSFGAQGDAVNAAARLMGLAQRGEILTSGRLRGAGAREFALQARPPIALKGRAEPMPVFALLGPQRQRAIRLQEPDFVLPMVGRDGDAQQIEQALQRVVAGRGEALVVVADAGMGKSRLLTEGVRLALQRCFVGYGGATAASTLRACRRGDCARSSASSAVHTPCQGL